MFTCVSVVSSRTELNDELLCFAYPRGVCIRGTDKNANKFIPRPFQHKQQHCLHVLFLCGTESERMLLLFWTFYTNKHTKIRLRYK